MMELEEKWLQDVNLMARRMALFYHFVAEVLNEELGEAKAAALLHEAIARLGRYVGQDARRQVEAMGRPVDLESFGLTKDLPSKGWKMEKIESAKEKSEFRVDHCPLAQIWLDMKTPLARVYCYVDQAKYTGYDPDLVCCHVKNVLDGDDCCLLRVTKGSPHSTGGQG